ncbi:MAG: hypothetical protein KDA24_14770 [Deltaproteobacteria bacterium]|nr:hypothetical protein [Deltaproteobacteria bacterium]
MSGARIGLARGRQSAGLVAVGGDSVRRAFPVGGPSVSMDSDGSTLACAEVVVQPGMRTIVRCDLLKGGACTVRSAAGTCD